MKDELLRAVDEGRRREAALEALVVDEPARPDGGWNAKDHLAHLSWWRNRTADTLDAVRTAGALPPVIPEDDDVQNARIYAEVKDSPAAEVKAKAGSSWAALRRAIEASSEEDLEKPHPFYPDLQVWEGVPGAVGHSGTHVWSWLLEVGEKERAIEVARWSAEVEGRFYTTPAKLAESRYNLACIYSRLGNVDDALGLLRQSLEAKPELVAWAHKDPDLDPMRNTPGFKELLAT